MGHLWQRFLLASALLVGLAVGVAVTVFGYSNLVTVDIHWSVFHLNGVPLWAVAVVPVALILIAGTVYHWLDGLHHFTEHMRHRHRVRELETEITRLREHLDHVLEMPRGDQSKAPAASPAIEEISEAPSLPPAADTAEPEPEPPPQPAPAGSVEPVVEKAKPSSEKKKRSRIVMEPEPEPAHTNGVDSEPAVTASKAKVD
jgi:outer membrane biosynthesis protein TonB